MSKLLVSACLLGNKVRYDGKHNDMAHSRLMLMQTQGRVVALCPEVLGGLSVPRPPCEITSMDPLTIHTQDGKDCTAEFMRGAQIALDTVHRYKIAIAILKESSPSCGSHFIYDGTFSKNKIPGSGVTARLLIQAGVQVFNEHQIDMALNAFHHTD